MNFKNHITIFYSLIVVGHVFMANKCYSREPFGVDQSKESNLFQKQSFLNRRSVRPGPYSFSMGVCGGLNSGLTFKKFIAEEKAFEIVLSTRWQGISLTGLFEACVGTSSERGKGMIWNMGLGPRFGFYQGKYYTDYLGAHREDRVYSVIGLAGNFGFEHYFLKIPFTIGLDYRPYFDLKGADDSILDGVVSLRYVF